MYVPNGMMRGYRTGATFDRAHRIATVVLAADAAFPAEVLAEDARQAVLVERDAPKLTVLGALPSDATPDSSIARRSPFTATFASSFTPIAAATASMAITRPIVRRASGPRT